ncbi:MAG TPA: 30S ribosomal protein S20 [Firmicutes bacterium]|nr:30S ribosomal protein S20 [Bacillota bacterium]
MPNIKSAEKRVRTSEKRRARNQSVKSSLRTAVKKVIVAAQAKSPEVAGTFQAATSALDKAAAKGVIHPNKAARMKSRLAKRVNASAAE